MVDNCLQLCCQMMTHAARQGVDSRDLEARDIAEAVQLARGHEGVSPEQLAALPGQHF